MKWMLALAGAFLFSIGAQAQDVDQNEPVPHQKYPLALELTYIAAEAADCSTTLDIKSNPGYYEQNPLLGRHPSDGRIIGTCIAVGGLHAYATHLMVVHDWNPTVVKVWEVLSIGVETGMAVRNYRLGLRFKL